MTTRRRTSVRALALATAGLAALALAGCSSDAGPSDEPAAEATILDKLPPMPEHFAGSIVEEYLGTTTAKEKYTIGVAVPVLSNPTWQGIAAGIEQYADALGIEVRVVDGGGYGDPTTQLSQIDDFLALGVDGILITAVNNAAIEPAVQRAMDAGIPVIGMVTPLNGAVAYTGNNQFETGRLQCEAVASEFDKANVVMLPGPETAQFLVDRADGFKECAEEKGFTILRELHGGTERESGVNDMEDLIQTEGDDIDVVVVGSNQTGIGAMDAAERAGLDVFVVGAGPASTAELEAGFGGLVDASYVASGDFALAALIKVIQGEKVPAVLEVPQIPLVGKGIKSHDWSWSILAN
ncbi:sugar ABC transporter substrate-binding protein [Salinibacterium sp. ZJ454]|uniref:sugar ABC transporter substrate-binding protein n=1 Tax=Salinibacterium sp. ZJ454 TaxID=2708339 RepID=UPI00141ED44E|nr:sugar ABC transporter substrate-binding protein [Salinibacterium sp. ZJ454]